MITALTLFGKPTYSYSILKNAIESVITEANLKVTLNEIQNLSDIVKSGISQIPAVSINDAIHKLDDTAVYEYADKIVLDLLAQQDYGSLLRIIVPVNNAQPTLNGLIYGKQLSARTSSIVTVVNYGSNNSNRKPDDLIQGNHEVEESEFERNMSLLRNDHSGLPIESKLISGNPSEFILPLANARENNVVILGYDREAGLLDGIEFDQLRKLDCPIVLVPAGFSTSGVNSVLNYVSKDQGLDPNSDSKADDLFGLREQHIINSTWQASEAIPSLVSNSGKEFRSLNKYCVENGVDLIIAPKNSIEKDADQLKNLISEVSCPILFRS